MTTGCAGDQTCQAIVDELKEELDIGCAEALAVRDDFHAARKAFNDSRVAAGAAWRAVQAARDDHRAAGAVVRDAKAALNVAKDALRDIDMN